MSRSDRRATEVETWTDLALTVALALLAIVPAFLPGEQGVWEVLRVPLGFLLVFLLPGYAITAALHPGRGPDSRWTETENGSPTREGGPTGIERLVLSIGLSVVTVPLVGLVWNFAPQGIAIQRVLGSLAGVVAAAAVIAAYRRLRLEPAARFHLPLKRVSVALRTALEGSTERQTGLNVAIALMVVFAVVGVGAAVALPKEGEQYTELYLLSEDSESDSLSASDYPSNFTAGESRDLYVGIGNHEGRSTTYTVVVELQRLEADGGDRTVAEETRLDRFETTVAPNETERLRRAITPTSTLTGENLRLAFLLYKGEPPSDPTVSNAYREVHLWVTVSAD